MTCFLCKCLREMSRKLAKNSHSPAFRATIARKIFRSDPADYVVTPYALHVIYQR